MEQVEGEPTLAITYETLSEATIALPRRFHIWESQNTEQTNLILIAGPSGSGKSTLVEKLRDQDSLVLSLDRYYLGAQLQEEQQGTTNFSIPQALDLQRIRQDIDKLYTADIGEEILVPVYDMRESRRIGEEVVTKRRRILVEGVYGLKSTEHPTPFKIYVEIPDEMLLERRLDRDVRERGIPEEVVRNRFEKNVRPALEQYVRPQKDSATIIVKNQQPLGEKLSSSTLG